MRLIENEIKIRDYYKPINKRRSFKHRLFIKHFYLSAVCFLVITFGCKGQTGAPTEHETEPVLGCDGQAYTALSISPYALPFAVGETFETGLTNCSSSYHASGMPDQYAFDFNMPTGTPFVAARGGTVYELVEDASKQQGSAKKPSIVGNYIIIDHGDGTYGIYLHMPDNGINVEINDVVQKGDTLGVTGSSGLAGYPHLHFITVTYPPTWPYKGVPVSFSNAYPADIILKSYSQYKALPYK